MRAAGMMAEGAVPIAETPDTQDAASAAAGAVQGTALNGAQIASLLLIVDGVVRKQYPTDVALAMCQGAFPLMSLDLIKRFIDPLATWVAPVVTAPTANSPGMEVANAS